MKKTILVAMVLSVLTSSNVHATGFPNPWGLTPVETEVLEASCTIEEATIVAEGATACEVAAAAGGLAVAAGTCACVAAAGGGYLCGRYISEKTGFADWFGNLICPADPSAYNRINQRD